MFFMDILKNSESCLIKRFKNYFHTFVTNQFRYQMTKFKKCRTKTLRLDPKYVDLPYFWPKNAALSLKVSISNWRW